MAITIEQQPSTGVYISGGEHVYIASSDETGKKQHTIVAKVFEGSDTTPFTTVKKPLNAASSAVFDLGPILDSRLSQDTSWFDISDWSATHSEEIDITETFKVEFNEEELSGSSLVEINDSDVTSNTIRLIKGGIDYFDTDTRLSETNGGNVLVSFGDGIDKIQINETQEAFVEVLALGARVVAEDAADSSNTRTLATYSGGSSATFIVRVGQDAVHNASFTPSNYHIVLENTSDDSEVGRIEVEIVPDNEIDNTTTFRWFNRVWREFDFTREHTEQSRVMNKYYKHSSIDFNADSHSKSTNTVWGAGATKYGSKKETTYTVNSRWLDEGTMSYLDTIFDSEDVYVKDGDDWIPVIVTSNSYEGWRDNRLHQLQQRTLQYKRTIEKQLR